MVAIGESTVVRFIDSIKGIDTNSIYEQVNSLRKRLKYLKKQPKSDENRKEIKQIYQKIDELQFIPEYMMLIIDSDADYLRAFEGFQLNGLTMPVIGSGAQLTGDNCSNAGGDRPLPIKIIHKCCYFFPSIRRTCRFV